jgi:hypothetical protein
MDPVAAIVRPADTMTVIELDALHPQNTPNTEAKNNAHWIVVTDNPHPAGPGLMNGTAGTMSKMNPSVDKTAEAEDDVMSKSTMTPTVTVISVTISATTAPVETETKAEAEIKIAVDPCRATANALPSPNLAKT